MFAHRHDVSSAGMTDRRATTWPNGMRGRPASDSRAITLMYPILKIIFIYGHLATFVAQKSYDSIVFCVARLSTEQTRLVFT